MNKELDKKIQKLCKDIVDAHDEAHPILAGRLTCYPKRGRKFIKIIRHDNQQSVWGFINLADLETRFGNKFVEGDILKAAGWNAPALNKPRGNLLVDDYVIPGKGPGSMRMYGPDYLIG